MARAGRWSRPATTSYTAAPTTLSRYGSMTGFESLEAFLLGANDLQQLLHQRCVVCFWYLRHRPCRGQILPTGHSVCPRLLRSYHVTNHRI
jgi:hypothetical protein